jgi:hypothetical protein
MLPAGRSAAKSMEGSLERSWAGQATYCDPGLIVFFPRGFAIVAH